MADRSTPTHAEFSEIKAEHFESLGRTVVAFQKLEQAIVRGLLRLVEPNFALRKFINLQVLINELSFKTKLNVLANIIATNREYWLGAKNPYYRHDEFNKLLDGLRSAITNAGSLEQRRNQLFHSYWSGQSLINTPEEGTIFRQKMRVQRDKTDVQWEHLSADALREVPDEMDQVSGVIEENSWLLQQYLVNFEEEEQKS